MKEFLKIIIGDQQAPVFLGLTFFALLGAALSLLLQSNNRNPLSKESPVVFSWKFFFSDNWKRIVTGLIMIFIVLRFFHELFGIQITNYWAIAIGLGNDKIAQYLKDKTNLFGQKK